MSHMKDIYSDTEGVFVEPNAVHTQWRTRRVRTEYGDANSPPSVVWYTVLELFTACGVHITFWPDEEGRALAENLLQLADENQRAAASEAGAEFGSLGANGKYPDSSDDL